MGRYDGLRSLAGNIMIGSQVTTCTWNFGPSPEFINSSLIITLKLPHLGQLLLTLRVDISKHILSFGSNAAPYLFRGP